MCACVRRELDASTRSLYLTPLVPDGDKFERIGLRPLTALKAFVTSVPGAFPPQFDVKLADCMPWVERARAAKVGPWGK